MHICNIPNKKKYIKQVKNNLNIDPIIYAYMTNFCEHKIKLLKNFSVHYNLKFKVLVKFYLELCSNQILLNKEYLYDNDNKIQEEILNEEYYNGRKINNFKNQKNKILSLLPRKNINIKFNDLLRNNSKKDKKQVEYLNSFTRLFIGETDQKSIKERFLSNVAIKKVKELRLFNKNLDLTELYLKRLYKKLSIQNFESNPLLNKLKSDSKKVENFQRHALSFDKKNNSINYLEKFEKRINKKIKNH